ncbi:MAG: hypothetical protein Q8K60_06950 [Parachlamydiaceae bacterium]|nr:hypothetical protein [Parachlamydiaceae bacterium]
MMKLMFRVIFFFLCIGLTSCCVNRLSVQTQYMTHEDLASYYVGTPDPRLDLPLIGQRLLIQWCLRNEEIEGSLVELRIKIRLRNHEEKKLKIAISCKSGKYNRGYYLIKLSDEEYCETGGIVTYIVEILQDDIVIETWKHPLWVDLIKLS